MQLKNDEVHIISVTVVKKTEVLSKNEGLKVIKKAIKPNQISKGEERFISDALKSMKSRSNVNVKFVATTRIIQ